MKAWNQLETALNNHNKNTCTPLFSLHTDGKGEGKAECSILPFIVLQDDGIRYPDCTGVKVNSRAHSGRIHMVYNGLFEDDILFQFQTSESKWHRRLKNISGQPVDLVETGITLTGLSFGSKPEDDFFYHNENPRLNESEQEYNLNPEDLELPAGDYLATDIWSLETRKLSEAFPLMLGAHSSRLFSLVPCSSQPCILDSDVQITNVEAGGNEVSIDVAYGGDVTITLSRRPESVSFSCPESHISVTPGKGNWQMKGSLPKPGTLRLVY